MFMCYFNDRFMRSQITCSTQMYCHIHTIIYILSNPMWAQSAAVDLRSNLRHASSSTTGGVSPIPLTKSLNWTRWEEFKSTCTSWCKVTLIVYRMGRVVVLNYIFYIHYTHADRIILLFIFGGRCSRFYIIAIWHKTALGTPLLRNQQYKNILIYKTLYTLC